MASRRASCRSATVAGGSVRDTAEITPAYGDAGLGQTGVQQIDRGAVPAQQLVARRFVDGRGEFQQHREVVGQFIRRGRDPGGAVGRREIQQGHSPVPGIASGVVRQEQRAPPAPVERLGVLGGGGDQRRGPQVLGARQQRRAVAARRGSRRRPAPGRAGRAGRRRGRPAAMTPPATPPGGARVASPVRSLMIRRLSRLNRARRIGGSRAGG